MNLISVSNNKKAMKTEILKRPLAMFPSTYFYVNFGISYNNKRWMETPRCA